MARRQNYVRAKWEGNGWNGHYRRGMEVPFMSEGLLVPGGWVVGPGDIGLMDTLSLEREFCV